MIFSILLLWVVGANCDLPTCSAGVICPIGGIWSDWSNSDNTTCPTSCGSCSTVAQIRTCLTTRINCTCVGNSTRYIPCNTNVCIWPAQRSCCIPYIPMVINGTLQCGSVTISNSNSTACCADGGVWTQWSTYFNTNGTWTRSRSCISSDYGCPCNGTTTETITGCPCPLPGQVTNASCNNGRLWPQDTPVYSVNQTTCIATFPLYGTEEWCNDASTGGKYQSCVGYMLPGATTTCSRFRPFTCYNVTKQFTLTCDTQQLLWRFDTTGELVTAFSQMRAET